MNSEKTNENKLYIPLNFCQANYTPQFFSQPNQGLGVPKAKTNTLSVCSGEHLPNVTLNELYFVKLSLKSIDLCLDNEFNVKFGVNSSA